MGNNGSTAVTRGMIDFAIGVEKVGQQISDGVGAVGKSIGDTFYPDNPHRRDRVDQLKQDMNTFKAEFDSLKAQADQIVKDLKPKVDKLLHDNGFESADDMDRKMKDRLTPQALKDWEQFKKLLNRNIAMENLIFTVTGLVTIAGGIVVGALVVFGTITAATGGLALDAIGVVALALGLLVTIMAIVDASKERDKLRDAINQLCYARVEARQSLEQMRAYLAFAVQFNRFVENKITGKHSDWFSEYTNGGYERALELCTRDKIVTLLKDVDRVRNGGSWTNEDPDYAPLPSGKTDPVRQALDEVKAKKDAGSVSAANANVSLMAAGFEPEIIAMPQVYDMRVSEPVISFIHGAQSANDKALTCAFRIIGQESRIDCTAEDVPTGDHWKIHANLSDPLPEEMNMKDIMFTMTNLTQGKVYEKCRLLLNGYLPLTSE